MGEGTDPYGNFDARVWAEKFNETLVKLGHQPYDPDWLLSWFASAIMTGYDQGVRNGRRN